MPMGWRFFISQGDISIHNPEPGKCPINEHAANCRTGCSCREAPAGSPEAPAQQRAGASLARLPPRTALVGTAQPVSEWHADACMPVMLWCWRQMFWIVWVSCLTWAAQMTHAVPPGVQLP